MRLCSPAYALRFGLHDPLFPIRRIGLHPPVIHARQVDGSIAAVEYQLRGCEHIAF